MPIHSGVVAPCIKDRHLLLSSGRLWCKDGGANTCKASQASFGKILWSMVDWKCELFVNHSTVRLQKQNSRSINAWLYSKNLTQIPTDNTNQATRCPIPWGSYPVWNKNSNSPCRHIPPLTRPYTIRAMSCQNTTLLWTCGWPHNSGSTQFNCSKTRKWHRSHHSGM